MVFRHECQTMFSSSPVLFITEQFVGLTEIEHHPCAAYEMPFIGVEHGPVIQKILEIATGWIDDRWMIEIQNTLDMRLQKLA
jgi:hypothetical protein